MQKTMVYEQVGHKGDPLVKKTWCMNKCDIRGWYRLLYFFSLRQNFKNSANESIGEIGENILQREMTDYTIVIQYSGKLSRETTFTNFTVLELPAKVFSTKFGHAIPTWETWKY